MTQSIPKFESLSIGFKNFEVECIIGCLDFERKSPQKIEIDLRMELQCQKVVQKDAITETIDYMQVSELASNLAKNRKFELIESLAKAIASTCLENYEDAESIWLEIRKPSCFEGHAHAYCQYTKHR